MAEVSFIFDYIEVFYTAGGLQRYQLDEDMMRISELGGLHCWVSDDLSFSL